MALDVAKLGAAQPVPATPDAELIERARRGDSAAFAEIYDRHAPALLALAERMLASASEAQDLLHDVLLEAWQHVHEYDPTRAGVRTWLVVRTRSRALDRLGRNARDRSLRDRLTPGEPLAALHASLARPDRQLAVQQALAALEPNVRETLERTYFAGMTALEISDHMGIPLGTVKSRLARGLHALEHTLRELGGRDGA